MLKALYAAILALLALPAAAQGWPSHPIQLINPYPAGSTTDLLARALAPGLSARLGQPVVVVNRDGAAGSVGVAAVARAVPDGYTLTFTATTPLIVNPMLRGDLGYSRDSLEGICQTYDHAFALIVRPDSPLRDLPGLLEAARDKGNLQFGHLGIGSIQHLAGVSLAQAAGVELEPVTYRGDGAVVVDVQAGRVDFGITVAAFAVSQPVRTIALFAAERSPAFPGVPTVKELGYEVSAASYGGVLAPAGLPAAIKARLEAACAGAVTDEAYLAMARRTLQPSQPYLGAAAFAARMREDAAGKAALLRRIGLLQ
ncbi:tripartite tricarboxylate transporter substrate binding protein [Siccirubricoccus sp. KC 17139]|uniref:Tripartite tricarboxylate transporter substrate binding protein n=1 Tax=Siccirubricoccus soli TaxID=2899147 RepID=A0ABT1D7P5_9PROT|nr:tripartite tricarboxylate transporter substrate binding protein [Siccirubricoccus soli]MCO6417194.1 tripartite tricarboxylate transporter substrate binding protein [Siccirubricoccus soli]MCP2683329.1 tripartite tricarboxylate transporter substrate binding protein [Siccirubricoccus soli]